MNLTEKVLQKYLVWLENNDKILNKSSQQNETIKPKILNFFLFTFLLSNPILEPTMRELIFSLAIIICSSMPFVNYRKQAQVRQDSI